MQILNWEEVIELVGLSRSTIRRLIIQNKFPKPAQLSERKHVWLKSEVLKWFRTRARKDYVDERADREPT
jgi:predicted DNA-binding transcriptional regulator AlpA